jgi:hypothetical protein
MIEAFTRIVHPGSSEETGRLFIKIEWRPGTDERKSRLSISGVEGPKADGNARGGCGQIYDHIQIDTFNTQEGWSYGWLDQLVSHWRRWHLNDMRAGCEHQRAEKWDERPIDPTKPTDTYGIHFEGQRQPSWNMLTWVRPSEHPDGLMTKPCDVCGYRFGTAWLHEEVPDDVLIFLRDLPETNAHPAWV